MKYSVKWLEVILYTAKFPITFHLRNNSMFILSSTGDISMTMVHPMKKTFLFASSIFPWRLPFNLCRNFSQFLLHPFPHISSVLSPPPLPQTVHLTSSFLNSSWWLTTMNSYQSNTPIQNKKPTFRHHVRPSPSQLSVPYLWSAKLSHSLHLHPHLHFYTVKLVPAPAQATLAPLYPCSAQTASHVMCGQNEIHTKLKHSLHVPNCLRNSHLESADTKLQTLSLLRNNGSTRIISCKLTSVIRCHRILPCKFWYNE